MLLGQVICFLIAQLGRPNPIVQGLAYVKVFLNYDLEIQQTHFFQFQSIVKKHNKTPFSMVQPYLDQIAPFLISRMCSQPALFEEACRAMGTPPSQFIRSNLSRALPQLFANCEKAVLETVSKELGMKTSILFLNHSHAILAHVFLYQDQTKKALQFILKILEVGSQGALIDIVSVIKSCLVPLLTELVVDFGDDNSNNVSMVSMGFSSSDSVQRLYRPSLHFRRCNGI
jgi:serine/threonine-protein kinase ATR